MASSKRLLLFASFVLATLGDGGRRNDHREDGGIRARDLASLRVKVAARRGGTRQGGWEGGLGLRQSAYIKRLQCGSCGWIIDVDKLYKDPALPSCNDCPTLELPYSSIATLLKGTFTGMQDVSALSLKGNKLGSLPEGILQDLTTLRTCDLAANRLKELDGSLFRGLSKMRSIIIQQNDISKIDESTFSGLTELESLQMSYNSLTSLPPKLFADQSFRYIDLSYNRLVRIPDQILANQTILRSLNLEGNPLECKPDTSMLPASAEVIWGNFSYKWEKLPPCGFRVVESANIVKVDCVPITCRANEVPTQCTLARNSTCLARVGDALEISLFLRMNIPKSRFESLQTISVSRRQRGAGQMVRGGWGGRRVTFQDAFVGMIAGTAQVDPELVYVRKVVEESVAVTMITVAIINIPNAASMNVIAARIDITSINNNLVARGLPLAVYAEVSLGAIPDEAFPAWGVYLLSIGGPLLSGTLAIVLWRLRKRSKMKQGPALEQLEATAKEVSTYEDPDRAERRRQEMLMLDSKPPFTVRWGDETPEVADTPPSTTPRGSLSARGGFQHASKGSYKLTTATLSYLSEAHARPMGEDGLPSLQGDSPASFSSRGHAAELRSMMMHSNLSPRAGGPMPQAYTLGSLALARSPDEAATDSARWTPRGQTQRSQGPTPREVGDHQSYAPFARKFVGEGGGTGGEAKGSLVSKGVKAGEVECYPGAGRQIITAKPTIRRQSLNLDPKALLPKPLYPRRRSSSGLQETNYDLLLSGRITTLPPLASQTAAAEEEEHVKKPSGFFGLVGDFATNMAALPTGIPFLSTAAGGSTEGDEEGAGSVAAGKPGDKEYRLV